MMDSGVTTKEQSRLVRARILTEDEIQALGTDRGD
jgi:hypothetical protein